MAPGSTACPGDFFAGAGDNPFGMYNMFSGARLSSSARSCWASCPTSARPSSCSWTVVVLQIERLRAEGQAGRKKINQYTRYLTIGIAIIQSLAISYGLEQMKRQRS